MIQGNTAAEMLKESQDVIETNGEWQLIDIKVDPNTLVLPGANYSQIIYYVSTFTYFNYSIDHRLIFNK